jgi:hypothetical protein
MYVTELFPEGNGDQAAVMRNWTLAKSRLSRELRGSESNGR